MKFITSMLITVGCLSFAASAQANSCASVEREMVQGQTAIEFAKDKNGFQKAVRLFEKATEKAPGCADAYFNLGLVYEKTTDYVKAKKALEKYLQLSPNAEDAAAVRKQVYRLEFLAENQASGVVANEKKTAENLKKNTRNLTGQWIIENEFAQQYFVATSSTDGINLKWEYCKKAYRFRNSSPCIPSGMRSLNVRVGNNKQVSGRVNYVSDEKCIYDEWYPVYGQLSDDGASLTIIVKARGLDFIKCRWTGKPEEFTFVFKKNGI